MAIATMTRLALKSGRPAGAGAVEGSLEAVTDSAAGSEQQASSAIDQMVAYVPSEVIGIYIAGVGIIGPIGGAKWGLLSSCLALIPLFIWLSNRIERRANPNAPKAPAKLAWVCAFAVTAFLAWSAALPDTPFVEIFHEYATKIGSFSAIVLAALIPKLAAAVGIAAKP
jgi:hypothetical protein